MKSIETKQTIDKQDCFTNLKNQFKQIIDYLKNEHLIHKQEKSVKKKIQLHLVIGSEKVGKTNLLKNAALNIIHTIPGYTDITSHDTTPTWLITAENMFVEIPSQYLTIDSTNTTQSAYDELLRLIHQHKRLLSIQSVIVVANFHELITFEKEQLKVQLREFRKFILTANQSTGKPHAVYLLFTKCDLLTGFKEFFNNFSQDERNMILGLNFFEKNKNIEINFTGILNAEFEKLLQKLNDKLIYILQQENNQITRTLISDFPLQMESTKELINFYFYHLAEKTSYLNATRPQGIFFTSSVQSGTPADRLLKPLEHNIEMPSKALVVLGQHQNQPFFIKDLFQQISDHVNKSKNISSHKKAYAGWQRNIIYSTVGTIVFAATLYLGYSFKIAMQSISASENALAEYKVLIQHSKNSSNKTDNVKNIISTLDSLNDANQLLDTNKSPWILSLHIGKNNNFGYLVNTTYQKTIQKLLFPQIIQTLEAQLINKNNRSENTYTSLKAYLMLGELQHKDIKYLTSEISRYYKKLIKPEQQQRFIYYLNAALSAQQQPIVLNRQIIAQARDKLNQLPKPVLAYTIIKSSAYGEPSLALENIFNASQPISIPYSFTSAGFKQSIIPNIQQASRTAINGDWVLGHKSNEFSSAKPNLQTNVNQLAIQALTIYLNSYAGWWNNALAKIQPPELQSLNQLQTLLEQLSRSTKLPILLQKITENTKPTNLIPESILKSRYTNAFSKAIYDTVNSKLANTSLAGKFAGLDNLTNNTNHTINLKQINSVIKNFYYYIAAINSSSSQQQASFSAALLHIQQRNKSDQLGILFEAKKYVPPLLNSWLTKIADNSWNLILAQAKNYINHQWQTQVLSYYNTTLINRYPLYKNAKTQASLNEFSTFFAPHGILDTFFKGYISPFVDTQNVDWQWKTINGQGLNMSSNVLALFERAHIIREMFFPTGKPALDLQFSLSLSSLTGSINRLELKINNQTTLFDKSTKNKVGITWPGNSNSNITSLIVDTINGQAFSASESGPWSLFKLLQKGNITPTTDPEQYSVTFNINGEGNSAQFNLTANNPINPFIPGIIDQFRCPVVL